MMCQIQRRVYETLTAIVMPIAVQRDFAAVRKVTKETEKPSAQVGTCY